MKKRLLCGILLIALGAGVYFYPDWSAVRTKHQQEQVIRQFQSEVSISDMQQEQEAENEDTVWTETVLEQSKAYNETLFETEQAAFRDAEAVKVVPDFSRMPGANRHSFYPCYGLYPAALCGSDRCPFKPWYSSAWWNIPAGWREEYQQRDRGTPRVEKRQVF